MRHARWPFILWRIGQLGAGLNALWLLLTGVTCLALCFGIGAPDRRGIVSHQIVTLLRQPDGSWEPRWDWMSGPEVDFHGQWTYSEGWGWRRWTANIITTVTPRTGADAPPKNVQTVQPAEIDQVRRRAWQGLIDTTRPDPQEAVALGLLRDGRAELIEGWTYHLRPVLQWVGWACLLLAGVRFAAGWGYETLTRARMERVKRGLCGRCKYPFPSETELRGRCTECGTDIDSDFGRWTTALNRRG